MPKLCANLSMLFTETHFLDRFDRAAKAGFRGVEYISPYDFQPGEIMQRLEDNELTQVLFNLPLGDMAAGERGIACHPDRVTEFREGVEKAIEYAIALNCGQCNVLAGIIPTSVSAQQARETLVDNLHYAARKFHDAGLKLLAEAINNYDMPGFFLTNSAQAMELTDDVDNLYFQYDIYHMQRMEGELAANIKRCLPRIAHMQLADNPGRHEPGSGEINYKFLLKFIDQLGYDGWIGAEYIPSTTTEDSLQWMSDYLS